MSNKPLTGPKASDGYELHDASDPQCKGHPQAKRFKGIQPKAGRTCPVCQPTIIDQEGPTRRRRKATRP